MKAKVRIIKPRIDLWRELMVGDEFCSTRPYHELVSIAETLGRDGWKYEFVPVPGAYLVRCTERPT